MAGVSIPCSQPVKQVLEPGSLRLCSGKLRSRMRGYVHSTLATWAHVQRIWVHCKSACIRWPVGCNEFRRILEL